MRRRLAELLLSAPLLLACGCATFCVRTGQLEPGNARYVYPAVEGDVSVLLYPWWEKIEHQTLEGVAIWPFVAPFMLVDLPISVATDTLLLPYDLYMVTVGGKARRKEARKPPQPATPPDHSQPDGERPADPQRDGGPTR